MSEICPRHNAYGLFVELLVPENGWLEDNQSVPFGFRPIFMGVMVCFRGGNSSILPCSFFRVDFK